MDARIGTLDVRFTTRSTEPIVAVRLSSLTRTLQAELAGAMDRRLSATLGDGQEVVVVRELNVSTAIDSAVWTIDAPIVENTTRAYADALARTLARPSDDVVRFENQAEFLCSFIIDEMSGVAAERWYYGAFRPYRRLDARTTIETLLEAYPRDAASTLGRVARRGRLDDLLRLLGARRLNALAVSDGIVRQGTDIAVLIETALQLTHLSGWPLDDFLHRTIRQALSMRWAHSSLAWTDRRALSALVLTGIEESEEMLLARGIAAGSCDRERLARSLRGPLDWLDGEWLLERLIERLDGSRVPETTIAPESPTEAILKRIALAVTERRVSIREIDSEDEILVRLIAAAQLDSADTQHVPSLRQALLRVIRHRRVLRSRADGATTGALYHGRSSDDVGEMFRSQQPVDRKLTPAQTRLARAIQFAAVNSDGEETRGASLYLVSRALMDAGVPALARTCGVPLPALLAALAMEWLELEWPLDPPALAWTTCHAESGAVGQFAAADASSLQALEEALHDRLGDQRVLADDSAKSQSPPSSANDVAASDDVRRLVGRIARLLIRGWAHWLPGLQASSLEFLRERCLQRGGCVRTGEHSVEVMLDAAPLDAVLELAGYLKPIETLPWLGDRSVVFAIRRRATA